MNKRLKEAYQNAEHIWIDKGSRLVCMSDCHRGVGNRGDNFLPNPKYISGGPGVLL